MAPPRRLLARLEEATATPPADLRNPESVSGVALVFRSEGGRRAVGRIDDFACLDETLSVETALGIGKVLRLLRAARIAAPPELDSLKGDPARAASAARAGARDLRASRGASSLPGAIHRLDRVRRWSR